ncbi:hypothetical protein EZJ43_14585 [Pedobacter changchengzhani]|uniref:Uncharacterized protein n=1 Tax=Pedobacter changchengzhani TaxID=2529274 RepID=A0A4R5MIA1_9SPHI|nr:hypothetical protein [Pedobacter changchengzhani]TDG35317.1 hypothetical protein EZJ43_14585 [Pedobacter changchengzhani]
MKKLGLIIPFSIIFFFIPNKVFSEIGCLVGNSLLTNQVPSSGLYYGTPSYPSAPGCNWVLVRVIGGCAFGGRGYIKGDYEMQCPLDDYIPALLLLIGGIGFVHIRKTKFCNA